MAERTCWQNVLFILAVLICMVFVPALGHAEEPVSETGFFAQSRDSYFYHSHSNIELKVVNNRLIVLATYSGQFFRKNKLYFIEGTQPELIDSFWGYYRLLGGKTQIIISKHRVGFLSPIYIGATLYTITFDGKWSTFQNYVPCPYYAVIDGHLLYAADGEEDKILQWNENTRSYDLVLEGINMQSIVTFDSLLCISKPSSSTTDYVFWLPSERKTINVYCGDNKNILDFVHVKQRILWSNDDGIHSFNMETGITETLVAYSEKCSTSQQKYFIVCGDEVYYTDGGKLNMYNFESLEHKSWDVCPAYLEGFVVVNDILYAYNTSGQLEYTFLSGDLESGLIELDCSSR